MQVTRKLEEQTARDELLLAAPRPGRVSTRALLRHTCNTTHLATCDAVSVNGWNLMLSHTHSDAVVNQTIPVPHAATRHTPASLRQAAANLEPAHVQAHWPALEKGAPRPSGQTRDGGSTLPARRTNEAFHDSEHGMRPS